MKGKCKSAKLLAFLLLLGSIFFSQKASSKVLHPLGNALPQYILNFRVACQLKDMGKAIGTLKQIETWKIDRGLENVPSVSRALSRIYEGSPLYGGNSNPQRLSIYEIISRLSPDEPTYQWKLLKISLVTRPFDITNIFKAANKVVMAIEKNLGWSLNMGGQLILAFFTALFLAVSCFALNLIIKYASHLVFYVKHLARFPINNLNAVLIILFIFLFPIYFNIGFVWLPVFCMVLMWMILTRREKGVVFLIVIAFLMLSYGCKYVGRVLSAGSNKDAYILYLANYSQLDPVDYQRLKDTVLISKSDAEGLFTLGLLAKRRGDYKAAVKYYHAALKVDPYFSECMNNLGNVYLLMKGSMPNAVTLARTWYKRAIKINPNRAEYLYNLGKSFSPIQRERREYILKARELDPELTDNLTERGLNHPNQLLADRLLPRERIWHRAFLPDEESQELGSLFWFFSLYTPRGYIFLMPVIFIFLIAIFAVMRGYVNLAVPCSRCGKLFFRTNSKNDQQFLCHRCQKLVQRTSGISNEQIKVKENDAIKYQKRNILTVVLSYILPAGGFILSGKALLGFIMSFLSFLFLSIYIIGRQTFSSMALWFFGYSENSIIFVVLAVIIYLICLITPMLTIVRGDV